MATPRLAPLTETLPPIWQPGDLILNTYEVRQVYTNGGMALVYRVYHRGWGIDLAVKCPRAEIATLEDAAESIVSEAETWVNLGLYPHIVSCYYIRVLGDLPYIFMEYVDSGSLSESIEQGRLYTGTPDDVMKRILDMGIQMAWGMNYAHQKGLIHQDIKPANVLLTHDGIAKLTDFGMAQAHARLKPAAILQPGSDTTTPDDTTIIVQTAGMTPAYCSPEQASLQALTRRTDVWSWGVCMLEMFLGKRSWKSGQYIEDYLNDYLKSGPLVSAIPLMPVQLVRLLRQCFAHDASDRPRDGQALAEALVEIYEHETGAHYPRKEPRLDTILADSLNNRAVSLLDLGREADALEYFDAALKAQTSHSAALYNRSIHMWRTGQMTDIEALAILQEARQNQPDNWEPVYLTSLLHLERNDPVEAARMAEIAIDKHGELPALKNVISISRKQMQLAAGCLKVIEPQAGTLNCAAISSQGQFVAASGGEPVIEIWDTSTCTKVRILAGHTHLVRALKISPDGRNLLSACWDTTLRLWDPSSGECLRELAGHTDYVQDAAFVPGRRQAVSASTDGTLCLWDLETGQALTWFRGHADSVHTVAVTPNGRAAVSASYDNTLRLWALETGECVKTIPWVRFCTSNIALSPDGRRVLFAAGDNRLWLLDLESGQPVFSYTGHTGPVNSVQITPNGTWALSAGMDRTLRLWDLNSGRCLRTFTGHTSAINTVAVCPTRALAVTASSDQTLRLWRLSTGAKAPFITVLPQSTRDIIEISSQLEQIIEDAGSKFSQQDYPGAMQILQEARDKPEYQQNPRLMALWEQVGCRGRRTKLRGSWLALSVKAHPGPVNALALALDEPAAITGGEDGILAIWNLETGECRERLEGQEAGVLGAAVQPASRRVAASCRDGSVRIWDLDEKAVIMELHGHTSAVNCISISADGKTGLSGSNDNTLRLWDLADGSSLRSLKGHEHYVPAAAISPDGSTAVSASWDKTVRIWDTNSGQCRSALAGHSEIIQALALSPDGLQAATAGADQSIYLWDVVQGTQLNMIEQAGGRIGALAYSVDGLFLFSGDDRGAVTIWDLASLAPIRVIKAHTAPITALQAEKTGRLLVTVSSDQFLRVWRLDWDFAFPRPEADQTLLAYLTVFNRRCGAGEPAEPGRTDRVTYKDEQIKALLEELGYRGYGGLPMADLTAALRQAGRR